MLNPFAREDPQTRLRCAVLGVEVEDGVATLDPLSMQTGKMTAGGRGRIDLRSERINLIWATKPRRGIGLSASLVTNSLVKLGGTLSNPRPEMAPLSAATATGAAVATGGLSIVATGLWNRVTAEKNVCKQALRAIERRAKERESGMKGKKGKKKKRKTRSDP
jgi:hypothetical protein